MDIIMPVWNCLFNFGGFLGVFIPICADGCSMLFTMLKGGV